MALWFAIFRSLLGAWLLCAVAAPATAAAADRTIRLSTTTSTENSGLLQALLPRFERATGYKVHVIAVGTGKALRMGRDGDVDVVLVHDSVGEQRFVSEGFGVERRDVMYNDFVIVGPPADPAGIRSSKDDAVSALVRIGAAAAPFVSRGDDSGTHRMELRLWKDAGIKPQGRWYREAGRGMEQVLLMAGEFDAYTLADRGTWLAMRKKLPLEVLLEGDKRLFNPYGIIAVNPKRYADANHAGAMALIDWITSATGRNAIADFKIDGEPLFVPVTARASSTPEK